MIGSLTETTTCVVAKPLVSNKNKALDIIKTFDNDFVDHIIFQLVPNSKMLNCLEDMKLPVLVVWPLWSPH